MPEGIEVELYRRAAHSTVGRTIASVETPDAWFLKDGLDAGRVQKTLVSQQIVGTERIGKLLVLNMDSAPPLGLRFGMTGRIVVDGLAPIDQLEYSPKRVEEKWVRFRLSFDSGGELAVHDPRRLGGVTIDPNLDELGPDLYSIDFNDFKRHVLNTKVAIKSRLLDQRKVAGIGNLICDETLWRSGVRPDRPANSLDEQEQEHLFATYKATLELLTSRGGSHTGDLQSERRSDGTCPEDGSDLTVSKVGGRTTYFCTTHQV